MAWEGAVEEFLGPWRERLEVVGALVCGSYITGSPSPHSDLDVRIVLAPGTAWQERGNRIVEGFLVEYFANPPEAIREFFANDRERHRLVTATMFATGRILFARDRTLERLRTEAARSLRRPFPRLSRREVERTKYLIWDSLDNLTEAHRGRLPLAHGYHDHVQGVYSDYARFLRQPVLPAFQLHRYLTDRHYRGKYRLAAFPDPRFRRLLLQALGARGRDDMLRCAGALSRHAIRRMGGIDIDGWRLRSRL